MHSSVSHASNLRAGSKSRTAVLAATPARRHRSPPAATTCSATAALLGTASSTQALGQIASAIGVALGAYLVGSRLLEDESNYDRESNQECPTCGGTGIVECFCSRWSDNDVGCASCRGSGKMGCNSCGGGGTAVPIKAKLYIKPTAESSYRVY